MQENKLYFLENLLSDTSFKNWVFKKTQKDISFWNSWVTNNSEYNDLVYAAKYILIGIPFEKKDINETFLNKELDIVLKKIDIISPDQ